MQRSRRSNPYPFSWEIPVAGIVGFFALLVLGVQAGRSLANAIAGVGWVFVDRDALLSSTWTILHGDAGAGLDAVTAPASSRLLWISIGITEAVVLLGCLWLLRVALSRWGPTRLHGMATRAEAEQLLGRARLRKHAAVIRPDLYPRNGWIPRRKSGAST